MKTIGSVESFTGGLFASTIVSKPGASKFFKGSIVVYGNELKEKLGVDISNGVYSKKVAKEMAIKGKDFLNVDICVSFTGNAGPEVSSNEKLGQVFISINEDTYELNLKGDRNSIRKQSVYFAIDKLKTIIGE